MSTAYSIIFAISVLASVVLLTYVIRMHTERNRMKAELKPHEDESLVDASSRVSEQAAFCDEVPRLKFRLDTILQTSPYPVMIVNEDRKIISQSHSAEDELDQPRVKRGLLETMESHDLDDMAREAMESQEPTDATLRLYASGRRPFRVWFFPYEAIGSKECVIFLRDVADKEDYSQLRSQFAATVSHELRTPLTGIKAMAESLKDPEISKEDKERFLNRMDRESSRLAQLIDELLFLSSLESGTAQDLSGECELKPLTDDVFSNLERLTARFEATTENLVPEGTKLPLKDRMANMVISNLVENAIKYSGRGSRIEVKAKRDAKQVKVTVSDNGIGIDPDHLPHIFERFYRVDKSRSKHLGGTGLGLSIVKHIIESAGGEIEIDSREGFGTSISFSLPVK